MVQESKVLMESLEDNKNYTYGEIRGDIDVDMNNLSVQINIFDNEKGINEKKDIQSRLFNFIYNNFKKSLIDTKWDYLNSIPFGIIGIEDKKIKKGDIFNNKDGVFAISPNGADITSRISITGDEINTQQEGVYNLIYTVEDDLKNQIVAKRKITVVNIIED